MDLVQVFEDSIDGDEWIRVSVTLPEGANRRHISSVISHAAEDFVYEIGLNETEDGFELGFRSQQAMDDVLEYLAPEIPRSVGMSDDSAWTVHWARMVQSKGIKIMNIEPHPDETGEPRKPTYDMYELV